MRVVTTYERLHGHIRALSDREIQCLLVRGRPGTGKSHAYRDAMADQHYHLFSARQSPFQVYIELHDAPDSPVVFDDVSALLQDNNFRDMLKNLCETGTRTIRWRTATPALDGRPQAFAFSGPILIVLNCMPEGHPDVMAILDRCDCIEFDPPKSAVIARMHEIFPADGELIELLAELPVIPSLRTLVKARQWQQSKHLDWRAELIAECGVPPAVGTLLEIMQNSPEGEWLPRYLAATGQTDRSYRRHRKIGDQVLGSCASVSGCPNVRAGGNGEDTAHEETGPPVLRFPSSPTPPLAGNASG